MQEPQTYQQITRLFHVLWTKAVGTSDYNKQEWKALLAALDRLLHP